jgi:DNA polymerase-3 subunit beta
MELKTKDLARALRVSNLVIERRNTIPILSHALVTASLTAIEISSTNLDQALRVTMEREPMPTTFVAATLDHPEAIAKLITAGGADTVSITPTKEGGQLDIRCGELAGTINTLKADDFPAIHMSEAHSFEADLGLDAINMILRVAGAMSTEETRYYLNGVYFHHVDGWTYKVAATDGHRLYVGTIELPNARKSAPLAATGAKEGGAGAILPRHAIATLRKLRPHMTKEAPVRFALGGGAMPNSTTDLAAKPDGSISKSRFTFNAHGFPIEMITKNIDGTFPDYSRVIPTIGDDMPQITFRRADLRRALDGITAGMSERTRAVKLTFDGDKLIVSAKWIDMGFEATTRHKRPFEIGYNSQYLRGLIDASTGEELVLTAADAASPGSIVNPDATDFRAVLMPMRV